jgi:hypothetical protein
MTTTILTWGCIIIATMFFVTAFNVANLSPVRTGLGTVGLLTLGGMFLFLGLLMWAQG